MAVVRRVWQIVRAPHKRGVYVDLIGFKTMGNQGLPLKKKKKKIGRRRGKIEERDSRKSLRNLT